MKIEITGRQIEITPALKDFAEDKLRKLERLLLDPIEAHVVLAISKHRHIAEIQIKSRSITLSGTEETGDLYASIGEVADKLERQALKHKEKIRDHRHRRGIKDPETGAAPAPAEQESNAGPRIVRSRPYRLKPMSAEDAALELDASSEDLLVFREAESDRVHVLYRLKDGNFGLVEPES